MISVIIQTSFSCTSWIAAIGRSSTACAVLEYSSAAVVAAPSRADRAPRDAVARLGEAGQRALQSLRPRAACSRAGSGSPRRPAREVTDARIDIFPLMSMVRVALRALLDEEAAHDAVELGPHHRDVGDRAVGDPGLGAVQDERVCRPSSRASACPPGFEPKSGSVRPKQPMAAALARRRQPALLLRLGAVGVDRVHHEAALHRHEGAQPRVAALELLHDQAVRDVVEPRQAVLGNVEPNRRISAMSGSAPSGTGPPRPRSSMIGRTFSSTHSRTVSRIKRCSSVSSESKSSSPHWKPMAALPQRAESYPVAAGTPSAVRGTLLAHERFPRRLRVHDGSGHLRGLHHRQRADLPEVPARRLPGVRVRGRQADARVPGRRPPDRRRGRHAEAPPSHAAAPAGDHDLEQRPLAACVDGRLGPPGARDDPRRALLPGLHDPRDVAAGRAPGRRDGGPVGRQAHRVDPPLGLRPDPARPVESVSGADPAPGEIRPGLLREPVRGRRLRLPAVCGRSHPDLRVQRAPPPRDVSVGVDGMGPGTLRHRRSRGCSRRRPGLWLPALQAGAAGSLPHGVGTLSASRVPVPAALPRRRKAARRCPARRGFRLERDHLHSVRVLHGFPGRRRPGP